MSSQHNIYHLDCAHSELHVIMAAIRFAENYKAFFDSLHSDMPMPVNIEMNMQDSVVSYRDHRSAMSDAEMLALSVAIGLLHDTAVEAEGDDENVMSRRQLK